MTRYISILNHIDGFLGEFLAARQEVALLGPDDKDKATAATLSTTDEKEMFIDEVRKIQVLLSFSAELLRNSYNKDVYNSTEVRKIIHISARSILSAIYGYTAAVYACLTYFHGPITSTL